VGLAGPVKQIRKPSPDAPPAWKPTISIKSFSLAATEQASPVTLLTTALELVKSLVRM
jgi:hypothetical protein